VRNNLPTVESPPIVIFTVLREAGLAVPASHLAVDVGGVFEYYISPRVALRLDWGDTMIRFPQPVFTGNGIGTAPKAAGWYHSFQVGGGVSFRF